MGTKVSTKSIWGCESKEALQDRLFVCGIQVRCERDVIVCFLGCQYYIVAVGEECAHNIK